MESTRIRMYPTPISNFSYHRIPCTVAVRALADFLFGATINVGIDVRLVRTSALLNMIG